MNFENTHFPVNYAALQLDFSVELKINDLFVMSFTLFVDCILPNNSGPKPNIRYVYGSFSETWPNGDDQLFGRVINIFLMIYVFYYTYYVYERIKKFLH